MFSCRNTLLVLLQLCLPLMFSCRNTLLVLLQFCLPLMFSCRNTLLVLLQFCLPLMFSCRNTLLVLLQFCLPLMFSCRNTLLVLLQFCLPLMFSCRNTLIVLLPLCLTVSLQTGHGGQSGVCRPGPTAVLPPADVLPVRPGRTPRCARSQPQLDALHALEQGQATHGTSPWVLGCCVLRHHT